MSKRLKEKCDLWEMTCNGDADALMLLSLKFGVNTKEEYENYLEVKGFTEEVEKLTQFGKK